MVVMVWLPSGGLFCGRLAGMMFCTFFGVLEVPVIAGLMLLSQDLCPALYHGILTLEISSQRPTDL
jgi:hypothetical protein